MRSECLANTFSLRTQLRLELPKESWSFSHLCSSIFSPKTELVSDRHPSPSKLCYAFPAILHVTVLQALKHNPLVNWWAISNWPLVWLALLLCPVVSLETQLLLAEVKIICFDNIKLGVWLSSPIDWFSP